MAFGSWREVVIRAMIKDGKREFTLDEAIAACYPAGRKRPRHVGQSVAWTLRNMIAKSTKKAKLARKSGLGRGQKGVYIATGEGWRVK